MDRRRRMELGEEQQGCEGCSDIDDDPDVEDDLRDNIPGSESMQPRPPTWYAGAQAR